jgi:hypothetical protein
LGESIHEWVARRMEDSPPAVVNLRLPPAERQQTIYLDHAISFLSSLIDYFVADVEIFDHAEADQNLKMRWTPVACRDAAMTLWAFRVTLDHIEGRLGKCPSIWTADRHAALKAAKDAFTAAFPDAKDMRDIAGHPITHVAARGRRRARNDINGVVLHNVWAGRKVTNSYDGREISFELSPDTVTILRSIRKIVFDAFKP